MSMFVNFCLYEIGWFACVLGASHGREWLGVSVALVASAVHVILSNQPKSQIAIMILAALSGLVIDSALIAAHVFRFPSNYSTAPLPPIFMTVLWFQFATTFCYCMSWLRRRYLLCALLGFIGAPLAFLAGESFGAIEFLTPKYRSLTILASTWAIAVPMLLKLTDSIADRTGLPSASYRWIESESDSR